MQVNTMGTLNILEAVRRYSLHTRIYNAASSEMFGNSIDSDGYQRLSTPMKPVSPYGCSKLAAYNLCNNYRNSYDTFVCSGVLFNHESVRRGINFVTSKVIVESLKVKRGIIDKVRLGNLNSCRDWGHAKDYVRAMYMMLQQEEPQDYVVATGISRSVKDLVDYVFDRIGLTLDVLESDQKHLRPEELNYLRGDASKIKDIGWVERYSFYSMIDDMIEYWSKNLERCIYV
jgi:GDPmannose 4,6-dehydratase